MNISVRYTESILKVAIGAYIKRIYLKHLIWPSILAIALLAFVFCFSSSAWLQSFVIVAVLFTPSVVILGYWMRVIPTL